ncbi:hypothetical protein [Ruicaihuangia caeni]|uniref:PH domain-containing protein n=1 Tax=Ruicaihuangia caeni TaxID=3042517 RepID=A0AAW6T4Q3_9MICO|nr:hypothetical protein [Klugiella sp. YN-L-19]MDI2098071.1 hypothetical protein [Klugiella sp. YN-L-19]
MDKWVYAWIALAFGAVLLGLMALGWRNRVRRQGALGAPLEAPSEPGRSLRSVPVLYVATTAASKPLERVAVRGLGFRARGALEVLETGITLDLAGSAPVFIPADHLVGAGRATWTIDRVVEPGGLLLIGWLLGGAPVESYLRLTDRTDLDDVVADIRTLIPDTRSDAQESRPQ